VVDNLNVGLRDNANVDNRGKVRCSNPLGMADSDLTSASVTRSAREVLHAVGDASSRKVHGVGGR